MATEVAQRATSADIPADTFAARLMLARMHAGHLSIREAADKCGIGRGAWTNWERGARPVGQAQVAQMISDGLGVDRDWLLWGGPLAESNRRCIQIAKMDTAPPPTSQRRIGRSVPDLVRPPHMTRLTGGLPGSGDDQSTGRPVRLSKPVIG